MHTQPFGAAICDRTIRVHGELDMAAEQQLIDAVTCVADNNTHRTVVVDMTWLTFLDSAGIAALVRAHKVVDDMGKELVIHSVPAKIHRTLRIAGVADYLNARTIA